MSIHIEIQDGTTPMLDEILKLSYGMALESLSVAGSILQKNARNAMKRRSHHWIYDFTSGKRVIKKSTELKELGLRISQHSGQVENPDSMSNMITSFLMAKSLTVVVGGQHKAFTPIKFTDGKPSGLMGRVGSVGKKTHSILHKLNFGERDEFHGWTDENGTWSKKSMPNFANARYVGYHFMENGYSESKGAIVDAMTKRYSSMLHKAVDRANVKIRKRKVA